MGSFVQTSLITMGSHQKKGKKIHNNCELSPKMENPPPPISQQFQPLSEFENQCFFAIIKSQ